jgi:hypothetical protein
MLLWAIVYTLVRKILWFKFVFGFLQVASSLWANWYQLEKLSTGGRQSGQMDRIILICGGIALMSKGVRDIEEAISARLKRNNKGETPAQTMAQPKQGSLF